MGGDSCSEGHVFESRRRRLVVITFSHLFVLIIVMFVWKDKNKRKRGRGWPIFSRPLYLFRLPMTWIRTADLWNDSSANWSTTTAFSLRLYISYQEVYLYTLDLQRYFCLFHVVLTCILFLHTPSLDWPVACFTVFHSCFFTSKTYFIHISRFIFSIFEFPLSSSICLFPICRCNISSTLCCIFSFFSLSHLFFDSFVGHHHQGQNEFYFSN